MKYACDRKYINIDDVETQLNRLNSLLRILFNNYFGHSEEFVKKNTALLTVDYITYSDLTSVVLDVVQDTKETVEIVRQNIENAETA